MLIQMIHNILFPNSVYYYIFLLGLLYYDYFSFINAISNYQIEHTYKKLLNNCSEWYNENMPILYKKKKWKWRKMKYD